jgi:hypothetical protein
MITNVATSQFKKKKTMAWIHELFSKYFGLSIIENQLGEFDLIFRNNFQIL